jgi:HAMP domain-containing protein
MNRRRSDPRHSASLFVAMILGAVVAASGGVLYAYFKNRQIQALREIDRTERRIEQHQLDIRTTEMRIDQALNRFVIREELAQQRSMLKAIPRGAVEEVKSTPARAVALAAP